MDDPSRIIEPHEFGDFRKELLQVLQEVKQEANSRDPHNGDELDPSKYRFRPWSMDRGALVYINYLVLLDSPIRTDPSLMDYFSFNNTQPSITDNSSSYSNSGERRYPGVGRIKKKPSSEPEKRASGVMELVNVQTYLNRILK